MAVGEQTKGALPALEVSVSREQTLERACEENVVVDDVPL
jgi:hypothetical protein